ncbi:hypothetical protein C6P45_005456 [Maudiozyma exigua]|uniref:K Homology domain-containing protein n=1 Tax=Maudiozyma exigua TaxID=34358 RepID=A0A9P6W9G4_MAUEX|nr:hypothetical protein C6P45_005456 [Kazachstania exigua]
MVSDKYILKSAYETHLFYDVQRTNGNELLYRSSNTLLNDSLDNSISQLLKENEISFDEKSKIFYKLPRNWNIENTNLVHNDKEKIVTISGTTEDNGFEPLCEDVIYNKVPHKIKDKEINVKESFETKSQNFIAMIDDIVTRFEIFIRIEYNVTTDSDKLITKLIGSRNQINQCKNQVAAFLDLIVNELIDNKNYIIDYLNIATLSLLPFLHIAQNHNFVKNHLDTSMFVPEIVHSCDVTEPRQLIFTSNIHGQLLKSKDIIQERLQKLSTSIYYKKIYNISKAKLFFLKKFCFSNTIEFMIENHCFVNYLDDSIEFQAFSPILLNTAVKQFTLKFLQEIIEFSIIMENDSNYGDSIIEEVSKQRGFDGQYVFMEASDIKDKLIMCVKHNDLLEYMENDEVIFNNKTIKQFILNFEVNLEYEDFICGKKNGKLTRIIDDVKSVIELSNNSRSSQNNNDETMNLTVISNTFHDFYDSFMRIVNELPAEESFFIPEVYHRPIIGAGGTIVQTIMRKHNVFIQFSNSFSLPQNNLGITRYDNVIIRCPTKNETNIIFAKEEVLKLVKDFGYMQITESLNLTNNRFENMILASPDNTNLNNLIQLEKKYNIFVDFPDDLLRSDKEPVLLKLIGNDATSALEASDEIINDPSVWSKEVTLKISSNFKQFLEKENNIAKLYNEIIVPLEQAFQQVFISFSQLNSVIAIAYNRELEVSPKGNINKIVEFVTLYLIDQGMTVINKSQAPDIVEQ